MYVARNPRDCCVSYYHHQTLFDEGYRFTGDFEDFSRLFREGMLNYGNYWSHLKVRTYGALEASISIAKSLTPSPSPMVFNSNDLTEKDTTYYRIHHIHTLNPAMSHRPRGQTALIQISIWFGTKTSCVTGSA